MATLFSKPLPNNDKVVTSEIDHDALPNAKSPTEVDGKAPKIPLWDQLRVSTQNLKPNGLENETFAPKSVSRAARTPTRPTRSTRSSVPGQELGTASSPPKVEKYSVDVGLGASWNK